jgi:hyaluronoglucosaminidase
MIEGFYGPPWTHGERLDMIRFCGAEGLNTWVHAPKDDPYHRKDWRDPYPDEQLAQLTELVDEGRKHGVDFAYSIAPGLDIEYTSDAELETLVAKCEQVKGIGVATVQLLWDDIEHELTHAADAARYGAAERPSGVAQSELSNRFREAFPQDAPLVVCPMGYAGTGDSPYRRCFTDGLHPEIVVYWTGPEVVSIGISRESLNLAVERFRGHTLLLWDNFPVNDFDPERLFLGRCSDATRVSGRGDARGTSRTPCCRRSRPSSRSRRLPTGRATRTGTTPRSPTSGRCARTAPRCSRRCVRSRRRRSASGGRRTCRR